MVRNLLSLSLLVYVNLCFSPQAYCQDPQFSQYYAAPLNLNPALTGIAGGPRFNINYRNEWPKINNGFVTYALSYDQHFDKINSGFGIYFYDDRIANGIINTYNIKLNYAYQVKLSRKVAMQLGIDAGYLNQSVNFSQLTFDDQINPVYGFQNQLGLNNITQQQLPPSNKLNMFDMGAGAVVYSKDIYGGISFQHITQPHESFYPNDSTNTFRLPLLTTIHAGGIIRFSKDKAWEDYYLSPNVLYSIQGGSSQLNIGAYGNMKYIFVGFFFRDNFGNPDAVIGVVGVQIKYIRIGYSYDYTVSGLEHDGGAHELSLSVNLGKDHGPFDPARKPRRMECPATFN